jgi:DNA-binding NarL/FixJ family response regulator
MIKLAIVEDQPQLLRTLKAVLSLFDVVEIIWTARNGQKAVDELITQPIKPDAILMDIEMPVMNGIDAVKQCKSYYPNLPIVMLTVFEDDQNIFDAILAGASGYMLKGEKPIKILQAIEDAIEGRMPMSPKVAMKALNFMRQELPKQKETTASFEDFALTKREIEILEYLSSGRTYPQIAEKLFISRDTVRNHVSKIYKKLMVKSKAEVIQMASKNKWF